MSKNSNLQTAKSAKNDEFYTQLTDIEKEMKYYKDQFKGKTVYCNCDDARESNFFKYFSMNFEHLGLKRLITTGYKKGGHGVVLIYEGDKNGNRKVDDEEIMIADLEGDGDFRSDECIEFLKEADIVVTNPPFSLFREYVKQLMDFEKKFIILGNTQAITYKEVFPFIKNNQLWLGCSTFNSGVYFEVPDNYQYADTYKFDRERNGKRVMRVSSICWYTNVEHNIRHTSLDLYKKYDPKEYPKYDNYCGFECSKVSDIPTDEYIEVDIPEKDYSQWEKAYGDDIEIIEECENYKIKIKNPIYGVPITFLDKYCPEQFEIVDINPHFFMMVEQGLPKPKQLTLHSVGKKDPYARILIKRR